MKLLLLSAVAFLCLQLTLATEGGSKGTDQLQALNELRLKEIDRLKNEPKAEKEKKEQIHRKLAVSEHDLKNLEISLNAAKTLLRTKQNKTNYTEQDLFAYGVISLYDIDNDKQISKSDLGQGDARVEDTENALEKQFKFLDKNGNGIIEPEELQRAQNLEQSLLTAINCNCDINYIGKISENSVENAIARVKGVLEKVDNQMVADVKMNKTEFYKMMATFKDGKEQAVLEFAASTSRQGDYEAELLISKDDTMKSINKVIDILETLRTNFGEVDKNKNGAIERIEIIRKLVEMDEAVDTEVLIAVICNCNEKVCEKLTKDAIKERIQKFKDVMKNVNVNFAKVDTNGDGKLNSKEVATIHPQWIEKVGKKKN